MSTLSPKGQALVRAGRRAYQPSDVDRARLLDQLRSRLGDAALPASMNTATTALTVGSSTWPLLSAVVVGLGILGGTVFYVWPRAKAPERPAQAQTAPVAVTTEVPVPVAPPAEEAPTLAAAPPPLVQAQQSPSSSSLRSKDRLTTEVALLVRATSDLRAGRPAEALRSLDEYRTRFPKGVLGEEQRAARVQALCALGRFDEANASLVGLPKHSLLAIRAKQFCDSSSH
jgi:hypothetical protein